MSTPYWAYGEYTAFAHRLAKTCTRQEITRRLVKAEADSDKAGGSHLRAIERSTSMQSNSQSRAQTGNVVRGNYEERQALRDALEIYDYYPEKTKQAQLGNRRN